MWDRGLEEIESRQVVRAVIDELTELIERFLSLELLEGPRKINVPKIAWLAKLFDDLKRELFSENDTIQVEVLQRSLFADELDKLLFVLFWIYKHVRIEDFSGSLLHVRKLWAGIQDLHTSDFINFLALHVDVLE